jgi:predicted nucleic acid-binding protein
MTIIVDANIVFSILINPSSKFGNYLLSNPDDLIFISPNFLKKEIAKHQSKILKITKYDVQVFDDLIDLIYSHIRFYSLEIIPDFIWNNASAIMENNDDKDIPYLAFSLFFSSQIWTGDKSFCKKLSDKGHNPCFTISE